MPDPGSEPPTSPSAPAPPPAAATQRAVTRTGAAGPHPGLTPPRRADRLATFEPSTSSSVWIVGAHGGAGESTLAEVVGGAATDHRWPQLTATPSVLLVARTSFAGITAAQAAAVAWAAGATPPVRVIGLAWVADAPGRLPRPLADFMKVVSGSVPHHWVLPWFEDLRRAGLAALDAGIPKAFQSAQSEIHRLIARPEEQS
ncbi:hypothetical protein GCM10009710_33470 [Aeromicrobium alkaliterrae]|uniref:Uncharacterized protein n=1 Tax=Aeromicrobium alkaliterrae TaxID=302168 RepID=A0ABP4WER0_9ACTN